jgi:hypothetical protein
MHTGGELSGKEDFARMILLHVDTPKQWVDSLITQVQGES